jgi:hypothetical protein
MKRSTRFLIVGIAIEAFPRIGGFWLATRTAAGMIGSGGPNPEAAARIFEMMGMICIPLALLIAADCFSLKRNGK